MRHWSPDEIAWAAFDAARLTPDLLAVVKAAAMVERNAADYAAYLKNIFKDDPEFRQIADKWQAEEVQHGEVLGRYAELADPHFRFRERFQRFVDGYRVPIELTASVRGSLTGELLSRCIVETGTSSFYSAIRDATDEPVLKTIAHRIAGDEFRHFKTFYGFMRRYNDREGIGLLRRALVAIARIRETDDDELAYAFHAGNEPVDLPYDRARCNAAYAVRAWSLYRPPHIERAVNMVLKVIGLEPRSWLGARARSFAWKKLRSRAEALRRAA